MEIIKSVCAGLLVASFCGAQNVAISGTVKNGAGVGIAGAIVRLETGKQTATTGANGGFTLSGGPLAIDRQHAKIAPQKPDASLRNGYLYVNGGGGLSAEIRAVNLRGEVIASVTNVVYPGARPLPLPSLGAGVYMYAIRSGNSEILLKSCLVNERGAGIAGSSPRPLTKQARSLVAINDVIAVTKAGYLDYRMIVTNSDTTGIEIQMMASAGTVTDIDGNVYQTIKIGNQEWTAQNLRTTKFNDGTAIPKVADSLTWYALTGPGYCYYTNTTNGDSINKYGALYTWYAVGTKKLAPTGWHVPADSEWDTLQNYLIANGHNWDGTTTDNKIAKSLAAKADWSASSVAQGVIGNNVTLNNKSGFSALPAGVRLNYAAFTNKAFMGCWWSATEMQGGMPFAYYRYLSNEYDYLDRIEYFENSGFSVRLVKD